MIDYQVRSYAPLSLKRNLKKLAIIAIQRVQLDFWFPGDEGGKEAEEDGERKWTYAAMETRNGPVDAMDEEMKVTTEEPRNSAFQGTNWFLILLREMPYCQYTEWKEKASRY